MARLHQSITLTRLHQGIDSYALEISPADIIFIEGQKSTVWVEIDVYEGKTRLPYGEFLTDKLSDTSTIGTNLTWSFYVTDEDRFRFRLVYSGTGALDKSLTVKVTLPDKSTRTRQLRVRAIARDRSYMPTRIRLWDMVPDGSILTPGCDDSDEWTDVVFTRDAQGRDSYWKCTARCTKVPGTLPSDPGYDGKLTPASDFEIVATSLLLAKNAAISLLQGNRILLQDESGRADVGLQVSESDIRIWAGSPTPAAAPFRVLRDGSVMANKGTFAGLVMPMVTTITSLNYKNYLLGEPGTEDAIFDFRRLTGHITFTRMLDPLIATGKIYAGFYTCGGSRGGIYFDTAQDYIGSRLTVENFTTHQIACGSYIVETRDGITVSRYVLPGHIAHFRCIVRTWEGKRQIVWLQEYNGPP